MTHKKTRESEGLKGLIGSGPATRFWATPTETGAPLTREAFERAMGKMKDRFDWELANPHGTENNPHIVSPKTMERGYGICVECGSPVGNWPDNLERESAKEKLEQVLPRREDGRIEFDPPISLKHGGSVRAVTHDDSVLVFVTRQSSPVSDARQ